MNYQDPGKKMCERTLVEYHMIDHMARTEFHKGVV
jgi:hypothetical protein